MAVQTAYSPDKYPLSSVIDWGKEEERLAKQKEQQQVAQKRIAKTQLLGDTFKLLAETAGAFGGADVEKREANPYYLQSVQDYQKANTDYTAGIDQLRQNKYSTLLKDKERELSLADQQAKAKQDMEVYGQKSQMEAQQRAAEAEAAHKRDVELQNMRSEATSRQQREGAQLDRQAAQAKEEEEAKKGLLSVATYDDPMGAEVDIARNKAVNLMPNFKAWFEQTHPNDELPASANIENNGIIRDEDLIMIIRSYPEFFGQYYPQLYTKGIPEPEKPAENRFGVYDRNVQAAMDKYKIDPSWNEARKARVQRNLENEITRLNGEYADVLTYRDWQEKQAGWKSATGKANANSPQAPQTQVTDVSSFWN